MRMTATFSTGVTGITSIILRMPPAAREKKIEIDQKASNEACDDQNCYTTTHIKDLLNFSNDHPSHIPIYCSIILTTTRFLYLLPLLDLCSVRSLGPLRILLVDELSLGVDEPGRADSATAFTTNME